MTNFDNIYNATQLELDRLVPRDRQIFKLIPISTPNSNFKQIDLHAPSLVFGYIADGMKINQTIACC